MRTRIVALAVVAAATLPFARARAQGNLCAQSGCAVVFDWGNGGTPPDVDRMYGSPAALEASLIKALNDAGWRVTSGAGTAPMSIMIRLTPQNRVRCEAMEGTNTDVSCHTVARGVASFTSSDTAVKAPNRIEIVPRCSDPKNYPSFAQFGQYAGEMIVFQLEKSGKGSRPSLKCRF